MAASYPTSAKSFSSKATNDAIEAAHVNDLQDEVTAVESALLTGGLAHNLTPDSSANARTLGSTSKAWGLSYLKGLMLSAATELTIASGAITVTQAYHSVDTESDAATDDLATITAGSGIQEGALLVLRAENTARVVTLKDGTGNLLLNGDYALSATDRTITLLYDGTNWREVARSYNAAPATDLFTLGAFDDTQDTSAGDPEEVLYTYTIPANTLAAAGDTVEITAVGTLAGDTDAKVVRLRLGGLAGTIISTVSNNSASDLTWRVTAKVTRIASNSQRCVGEGLFYSATAATRHQQTVTTATATDSGTIDLVVTADGVNAGDIVYEAGWVEIKKAS